MLARYFKCKQGEKMPHPDGGRVNYFNPRHDFNQAYRFVENGVEFTPTTGETIYQCVLKNDY